MNLPFSVGLLKFLLCNYCLLCLCSNGRNEPTYTDGPNTGTTRGQQVFYNPSEVTFEELCDVFFGRIDPTQVNGQGGDRGTQYRTGVYPHTKEQEDAVRLVHLSLPLPCLPRFFFGVLFDFFPLACFLFSFSGPSSLSSHRRFLLCCQRGGAGRTFYHTTTCSTFPF